MILDRDSPIESRSQNASRRPSMAASMTSRPVVPDIESSLLAPSSAASPQRPVTSESAPGILVTRPSTSSLIGFHPLTSRRSSRASAPLPPAKESDDSSESDEDQENYGRKYHSDQFEEEVDLGDQQAPAEPILKSNVSSAQNSTGTLRRGGAKTPVSMDSRKFSSLLDELATVDRQQLLRPPSVDPALQRKGKRPPLTLQDACLEDALELDDVKVQEAPSLSPESGHHLSVPQDRGIGILKSCVVDASEGRRNSQHSTASRKAVNYATSMYSSATTMHRTTSPQKKQSVFRRMLTCWRQPTDSDEPISRYRWQRSRTFTSFLKSLILSSLILTPGLICHYLYPSLHLADVELLLWLAAIASMMLLFPMIRLILHIIFYHLVPEKLYEHARYGNTAYYAAEMINYMTFFLWLLSNFVAWNLIWPTLTYDHIMQTKPLNLVNPAIGVFALWAAVIGFKTVLIKSWMDKFHQKAFLDRVREALFLDFMIETMREAKRRKKILLKTEAETTVSVLQNPMLRPNSKELRRRAKYVVTPQTLLLENDDTQAPAAPLSLITAHAWKQLLDHFYHVVLLDEQILEEMEDEADQHDEELLKAVEESRRIISKKKKEKQDGVQKDEPEFGYHHLHRYHYSRSHRRLNRRRVQAYTSDERSSKMAAKLFKILKQPERAYLDLKEDIAPLFSIPRPSSACDPTATLSRESTHSAERSSSSSKLTFSEKERNRQEEIAQGVYNFLSIRSDNGQLSERELRFTIMRANRELTRLVASLAGMQSPIRRVNDFLNFLLSLILLMATLTIFGVDAFGTLLSISSALVSFAFFFGGSARSLFESVVFLFFIHPFDVGDRIVIEGQSYLVNKINLLSTILERWDGQLILMPNTKVLTADIYNYRRSSPQWESVNIKIAFHTPKSTIDALAEKLNKFVESDRVDFSKKVGVRLDSFVDLESCNLVISYCHRTNWQNFEMYQARRAKFFRALHWAMNEVGIRWNALPQTVELVSPEEEENNQFTNHSVPNIIEPDREK